MSIKAISFGEILFDVINDVEYLGGAPLNLSAHLAKLNNETYVISAVGNDERGERVIESINKIGVDKKYIKILDNYPTGYVIVETDNLGKPTYDIHENVAWDNITATKIDESFDVFYFGSLAQRSVTSRNTLFDILKDIKITNIFFDVNLRQNYYSKDIIEKSLYYATIVKLNDEEVIVLARILFGEDLNEKEFADKLSKKFNLGIVIITRGEKGCAIWYQDIFSEYPGKKVIVADTVGAGDAFSAGFIHTFLKTNDIEKSADFAILLGGYVASKNGAVPDYDDQIKKAI